MKKGVRPTSESDPGGAYDGTYVQDYVTNSVTLDECNGMNVNGRYRYYVTDTYPWVMNCYHGTPSASFSKGGLVSAYVWLTNATKSTSLSGIPSTLRTGYEWIQNSLIVLILIVIIVIMLLVFWIRKILTRRSKNQKWGR